MTHLYNPTQTFVRPRYQGEGPSESCIINGHLLGWTNCTPASFAMAVEAATNLQKHSDPCTIRRATGDTSGGTTLRQCADAVNKLYGIYVATYTGANVLTPQRVAREVRAGRRCVVQGNTSALIGKPQQSTQGGVNHAVMVNEVRGGTLDEPAEALVYDPAADGRQRAYHVDQGPTWWPWSLVKTFCAHLRPTGETGARLGPGKVYTGVFPDSEPHVRLIAGAHKADPFPDRVRANRNIGIYRLPLPSSTRLYGVSKGRLLVVYQYATGTLSWGSTLWGGNDDGTEWVPMGAVDYDGGAS